MVIRESQKLICKPLTQISDLGGTTRRGQNVPSVVMRKVAFVYIRMCIIHGYPSPLGVRGHPDTSLGFSSQFLAPLSQSLSSPGSAVLSVIGSQQKTPVLLPGTHSKEDDHSKERRGKD